MSLTFNHTTPGLDSALTKLATATEHQAKSTQNLAAAVYKLSLSVDSLVEATKPPKAVRLQITPGTPESRL